MTAFQDKSCAILGIANSRSISAHIAEELSKKGAKLALSYLSDEKGRAERRVLAACEGFQPAFIQPCNLNKDEEIQSFFARVGDTFPKLDMLVHGVAFAPLEDIKSQTFEVSRSGFLQAMESSVYSFIASVKAASPYMVEGSSILTLSYFGAEKVMPGYNLMGLCKSALESSVRYLAHELGPRGIRVNAISAGALRTLASSAIPGFQTMLSSQENSSPLRQKLLPEDIAKTAAFLLSDEARSVTGEVMHVDCGFNIMGSVPINDKG